MWKSNFPFPFQCCPGVQALAEEQSTQGKEDEELQSRLICWNLAGKIDGADSAALIVAVWLDTTHPFLFFLLF